MNSRIERRSSLSEFVIGDRQLLEHSAIEPFRVPTQRAIALGANCIHDCLDGGHEFFERLASLEETVLILRGQILLMDDAQRHESESLSLDDNVPHCAPNRLIPG